MKSESLRLSEVRAVFRPVGECRDLGTDPEAWRGHVTRSLKRPSQGARSASATESARFADGETPGKLFHALSCMAGRHRPPSRSGASYCKRREFQQEPVFRAVQAFADWRGLCTREQVIDGPMWSNAPIRNETFRSCEIDEFLFSFFMTLPGAEAPAADLSLSARGRWGLPPSGPRNVA